MSTAEIAKSKPRYAFITVGTAWFIAEYSHDHQGQPLYKAILGPFLIQQDAEERLRSIAAVDGVIFDDPTK